jgi:organic hydroperoxide reductase OsmC/OhrA
MTTHNAVVDWSLDAQSADADYLAGRYSRAHVVAFDGGLIVPASASPSVVRAPWSKEDAADPEELLVASTASCHMLWFLDFARQAGLIVRRYHDEPAGAMGAMADGTVGLARITLRPAVAFGGAPPSAETIRSLHHKAHAACNIANSLKSEVVVEPRTPGAPPA